MNIDESAARDFMVTHARILDRRRFELRRGETDPASVLAALDAYRNRDGGYGWGLEADLRSPESQPGAALHAFEVFEDIGPVTAPQAVTLCDWLDSITLADGGVPMAQPLTLPVGSGPWWTQSDKSSSSLQITAITAASAHRVAAHDAAVAEHPWLERATDYCASAIESLAEPPFAYALAFAVAFVDALHRSQPDRAEALLERLRGFVPADGRVPVTGGVEGESLHPLDIAPRPDSLARSLFADDVIAADLERLAGLQQEDGGWVVDFRSFSPAATLEWRGYATVQALDTLRRG
jgi:hypothetical protein